MKLKKIHRILELKQSDWVKSYIDFNTDKRIESDKNFFNLISNAVYGKTTENLRKRIKIRVVKNSHIHQDLQVLIVKYLKII